MVWSSGVRWCTKSYAKGEVPCSSLNMDLRGVAFLGSLGLLVPLMGLGKLWLTGFPAPQQGPDLDG